MEYTFDFYKKSADYILNRLGGFVPEVGVILGTGTGDVAEGIADPVRIPYRDIPNFLISTAPDHRGEFIFGIFAGKKVACMSGRFHHYEGYDFAQLAAPVNVMKLLGVKVLILTNAAGAVNENYLPGEVMLISDHIKLSSQSPLIGKNVDEFGPRFFDMTRAYDPHLRAIAKECAFGSGLRVHEGVYMFFAGPQFETPAEIRASRILGADAVGMSTVTEVITAAHCSLPVLAMSLITNMAAGITARPLSGEEVNETARTVQKKFSAYLETIISRL